MLLIGIQILKKNKPSFWNVTIFNPFLLILALVHVQLYPLRDPHFNKGCIFYPGLRRNFILPRRIGQVSISLKASQTSFLKAVGSQTVTISWFSLHIQRKNNVFIVAGLIFQLHRRTGKTVYFPKSLKKQRCTN